MKYDDASWHYGGEFPPNSPQEFGATHIALYLRWCFSRGWAGEIHVQTAPDQVRAVANGQVSATQFFITNCDEKFTNDDLSEAGNAFTRRYYGRDGFYLNDYADEFGNLMYVAPEKEHDWQRFVQMIERRLKSDVLSEAEQAAAKPWWKFWS